MATQVLELSVKGYEPVKKAIDNLNALGYKTDEIYKQLGVTITSTFQNGTTVIEQTKQKLQSLESIKNSIRDSLVSAGTGFDVLKKKVDESIQTPTISRYWEKEANQVVTSVRKAENAIDNLKDKDYTPSQPLGFKIPDTTPTTKPAFADTYKSGFDDIDARLQKTQSSFQKLAQTKGDKGQFDTIYQGAFAAEKKVNDLTNRVRALRAESANPANSAFGKQYADGIREAEKELSRLEAKQRSLSRAAGASGGGRRSKGLGETGRAVLEFADDFVPAGLNKPFNAVVKELAKIESISIATVAPIAAIAAAGYGIVKISEHIKDLADQQLKREEMIASAKNKQLILIKEIGDNFEKQRYFAAEDRGFDDFKANATLKSIEEQKKALEELLAVTNKVVPATDALGNIILDGNKKPTLIANENFQRISQQILALEARAKAIPLEKNAALDSAFNQNFENRKRIEDADRQLAEKNYKERIERAKKLKETLIEFGSFISDKKLEDNEFAKVFNEIDSAGERMEKRFGSIGREYVKMATEIEKANLNKKLNFLSFQSDSKALKFEQDAFRLSILPDSQFASFQKAIDTFENSVNFFVKDNQSARRIAEASFYASVYNPNNPKSFAEYNRRGFNDDISDIGLQIRQAREDIDTIKNQSLNGTGVYGRGIAADASLSVIPPLNELVKRLSDPRAGVRGDAEFLIKEFRNALVESRAAQKQRFQDALIQSQTSEFGRVFARQQIDLINKSGLSDVDKAKQRADVVTALGNDLDPALRKQGIQDLLESAKAEREQKDEAARLARDNAGYIKAIKEKLDAITSGDKIKTDAADAKNSLDITVKDETSDGIKTLGAQPKPEDMLANLFGGGFNQ